MPSRSPSTLTDPSSSTSIFGQDLENDDSLSVVVLSNGAPRSLRETLASLVAQEPSPYILVVNNGGGDSAASAGEYAQHISIVDLPDPHWSGAARNRGLEGTRSRWVAFIGAGEIAEPGWVARRLAHHRSGVAVVGGVYRTRLFANIGAPMGGDTGRGTSALPNLVATSFSRAALMSVGGFQERIPNGEERELLSRLDTSTTSQRDAEIRTLLPAYRGLWSQARRQWEEGRRAAYFAPLPPRGRLVRRIGRQVSLMMSVRENRRPAWLCWGVAVTVATAHELGARDGVRVKRLARRTANRGQHREAISRYERIWVEFRDVQALVRAIQILIGEGDMTSAEGLLRSLEGQALPACVIPIIASQYYETQHDWRGVLSVLDHHGDAMGRDAGMLRSYLNAAAAMGEPERALTTVESFLKRAPTDARWLHLEALLRCRRFDEAYGAFEGMLPELRLRLPVYFIAPLFVAALRADGAAGALRLIETLAQQKATGWRLITCFFRERIAGHIQIQEMLPTAQSPMPVERQVAAIIRDADTARPLLVEMSRLFARMRDEQWDFRPDPSFVLGDAIAVARRILKAVRAGVPLSLVRLGDGEGNLLPYRDAHRAFVEMDFRTTVRAWWGEPVNAMAHYYDLQRMLINAIDNADIIGIPDLYRLSAGAEQSKNSRGLVACLDYVERGATKNRQWAQGKLVTSCHVHQALAYWHLWDVLIPQFGTAHIITCHPDLASRASERFQIRIASVLLIPAEAKYSSAFGVGSAASHFPARFQEILQELDVPQHGQIYLVAAGVLGKLYCEAVRRNGGIAVDIGSVADEWAGYDTRSLDEVSNYRTPLAPNQLNYLQGELGLL